MHSHAKYGGDNCGCRRNRPDGYTAAEWNKKRATEWNRRKNTGWTRDEFAAAIESQRGCCAICGDPMKSAYADHDHETGRRRGLLCVKCNSGLGFFNDSTDTLRLALKYMEAA